VCEIEITATTAEEEKFLHTFNGVCDVMCSGTLPAPLICGDKLVVSLFCLAFFSVRLMDNRRRPPSPSRFAFAIKTKAFERIN
jgi:hypothetical protein